MASETKTEGLPDLDDLLQCPVCYEIPTGQIFQCNEGHHVCGRCKARLALCPVCRAFFFGTRNYAMEELIANVRKLQAFKLGGKMTVTSGSVASESTTSADNSVAGATLDGSVEDDDIDENSTGNLRAPAACKGLFRCLCCKNGNSERLPAARLLNHLRYYHSRDLIEGKSDNGEYVQAWQIPTIPGRIVIAVRVADMGIFFLVIEISEDVIYSWVSMAAAPFVAHEFSYTITISGNDREAIFTDCVWSVRSCEGALKKRGRCLHVNGADARALTATPNMNGRIMLRRAPEQVAQPAQPRAFVRVANRGTGPAVDGASSIVAAGPPVSPPHDNDISPYLQHLHNDVARLTRAFATFGREATALVRHEAQAQVSVRSAIRTVVHQAAPNAARRNVEAQVPEPATAEGVSNNDNSRLQLSRNARRRLRKRLRVALNNSQPETAAAATSSQNGVRPQMGAVNAIPQPQRPINSSAPQSQRQINNSALPPQRPINNISPQPQHQINNSAIQSQRQINNSASQPQRQINNSATQAQRQINNSAAQQQHQINNSAPQSQRQINNSASQPQRQINNNASQAQRQINNSAPQPQRHINNTASQHQRRQPVNNVVSQEQPQQPRSQSVLTGLCPMSIVTSVETPSGSSGTSQNDNRPRSNKKKRPQQRW